MQVVMAIYYLVHNIAFIGWVIHQNQSQVSQVIQGSLTITSRVLAASKVIQMVITQVEELGLSLWDSFNIGCDFLIFCYLLIFVGIFSFFLMLIQIVMKKEQ